MKIKNTLALILLLIFTLVNCSDDNDSDLSDGAITYIDGLIILDHGKDNGISTDYGNSW